MVVTIEVLNSIRASLHDHSDEEDLLSRRNPALFGDEQRTETGLLCRVCALRRQRPKSRRRSRGGGMTASPVETPSIREVHAMHAISVDTKAE
jgi:hypothetical protein